jgi:muconolactone delta-isomerase
MIVNLASVDELDRMLMEHPFLPFMEVTVEPLVEAEAGSERFKDMFRAMMAA